MTVAKTFSNKMQTAGPAQKIVATHTVALYDPESGRIAHMHRVLTLEGGTHYSPEHHEQNARAYAGKLGHPVKTLLALHVPNHKNSGARCCVDVKKQALVEMPTPRKRT